MAGTLIGATLLILVLGWVVYKAITKKAKYTTTYGGTTGRGYKEK